MAFGNAVIARCKAPRSSTLGRKRPARAATLALVAAASMLVASCGSHAPPPSASAQPQMRRLTEQQYRNVIRDVFGPGVLVVGRFDPIGRTGGLVAVAASSASITPSGFERFSLLGQSIAAQVVSPRFRDWLLPCAPRDAKAADEACATATLTRFGRQLYRRPLKDAELKRLVAISGEAATTLGDWHEGVAYGLAAMLESPSFLFITDAVEPDPAHPGSQRLTAFSRAQRMSFLLWNSAPDDALLAAAEAGELYTKAGLDAQAKRLIASPRFEDGVRAFFGDMLSLDSFATLAKDATIYPAFGLQAIDDSREQMLRTIVQHVLVERGDYRDLFTSSRTFVTGSLGPVLGLRVDRPDEWATVDFPRESGRVGLLTLPGFAALHSHEGASSPTLRGKAVRELLMCQKVPDPPSNVDFSRFNAAVNIKTRTARDRLTAHNVEQTCAGCHKIMDPIGLALENLDGAAQFRATENGATIDTSGDLEGVKYQDPQGLGRALAKSPAVPACLVTRALSYSQGRATDISDKPTVTWLSERFAATGYRVPELMQMLAVDEAFYRVRPPTAAKPKAKATVTAANISSPGTSAGSGERSR